MVCCSPLSASTLNCSAQMVEPAWVELLRSRRCERQGLVLFMRLSVVLADVLCLLPALLLFARNRSYAFRLKLWLLSSPALLLVDHGHFQYNTLMLGLAVAGVVMLLDYRRPLVATALVCCSALFKQTGAYFVPAFAFYLLRQCIRRRLK